MSNASGHNRLMKKITGKIESCLVSRAIFWEQSEHVKAAEILGEAAEVLMSGETISSDFLEDVLQKLRSLPLNLKGHDLREDETFLSSRRIVPGDHI